MSNKTDVYRLANDYYLAIQAKIVSILPNALMALMILVFGYITAKIVALVVKKTSQGLQSVYNKIYSDVSLHKKSINNLDVSATLSRIMFWVIFIAFSLLALHTLESKIIDIILKHILYNAGNLFVCIIFVALGYLLGNYVRTLILKLSTLAYLKNYANGIRVIILLFFLILGMQQLSIKITLLNHVILVLIATGLLGFSILAVFAVATLLPDVIAMKTIASQLQVGELISIGEYKGKVIAIDSMSITILDGNNKTMVAGNYLLKQPITKLQS